MLVLGDNNQGSENSVTVISGIEHVSTRIDDRCWTLGVQTRRATGQRCQLRRPMANTVVSGNRHKDGANRIWNVG